MSPTLGKPRKARTPYQTRMKIFEERRQLDEEETQNLARSLNMSKNIIDDWFSCMPHKERRQLRIGEQYQLHVLQN